MAKVQIPETLHVDNKTFFAGTVEVDDKTAQRIKAELARRADEREAFDAAAEESAEQLGTGKPQVTQVDTKPVSSAERVAAHRAKQKAERDAAAAKAAADKAAAEAAAANAGGTGEGSGEQK